MNLWQTWVFIGSSSDWPLPEWCCDTPWRSGGWHVNREKSHATGIWFFNQVWKRNWKRTRYRKSKHRKNFPCLYAALYRLITRYTATVPDETEHHTLLYSILASMWLLSHSSMEKEPISKFEQVMPRFWIPYINPLMLILVENGYIKR